MKQANLLVKEEAALPARHLEAVKPAAGHKKSKATLEAISQAETMPEEMTEKMMDVATDFTELETDSLDALEEAAFGSGTAVETQKEEGDSVAGTFKRWSSSAVECYVREAKCEGCYYQAFFSDKPYTCKMDLAVDQLLETLGPPSKNLMEKYG